MSDSLTLWLTRQLEEQRAQERYRKRRTNRVSCQRQNNEDALDFAGNDYLGLSRDQRVIEASIRELQSSGAGATASPLVGGQFAIHQRLEALIAKWMKRPRALLYPSGFQANLGVLDTLCNRSTKVFHDRLNHASLLDGTRLSGARSERYPHLDMAQLEKRLSSCAKEIRKVVVSDAVFSMEGDIAPLDTLADICNRHDAWLVIDDAHGVGILGEEGSGLASEYGLDMAQVPVVIGTLSKALGSQGAFVAGSHELIETLIQRSRPYIYSTGLAPAMAAAAEAAITICIKEPQRRQRLKDNIAHFRQAAAAHGLSLLPSQTPVQAIVLGDESTTMEVAQKLSSVQIHVGAIRPPTVPVGFSRLRITLNALHTTAQIDRLVNAIRQWVA